MTPGEYTLTIRRGSVYRRVFTYKIDDAAVNLTGYDARAQVRTARDSTGDPLVSLTVGDGITLGGALGTITLLIPATDTAAFEWSVGVWDLELIPPAGEAEAFALLEGPAQAKGEVTRA